MNFDITAIIECVIALIGALVSAFLIPYLKAQMTQDKRARLSFWLKVAVEAAEQLFGSKTGQQKRDYVIAFLLSKGLVFDVDEVTALIESEVYKLTGKSE